jgi:hypothetical protein
MSIRNALQQWLRRATVLRRRTNPNRPPTRLALELLEGRLCPSGGYLFVNSYNTNNVLRYDETTGAFVDEFVKQNAGGLYSASQIDFGPDHNLYVGNGLFSGNNQANDVLRFGGTSGASLGVFADSGQLTDTRGVIFGPDGNLYVGDGNGPGKVVRYNGTTGAFLDTFVPLGSGGLSHPATCMLFGPDRNLYVIAADKGEVLRYDGHTGAFLSTFVPPGSGGLVPGTISMAFGPDGNLYVANTLLFSDTGGAILRFEGPAGPNPGAFLGAFVAAGSGGLDHPLSIIFGPGGNLYVGSAAFKAGNYTASPHTSEVLRYDGTTGAFLGTFVAPDSGGLRFPQTLVFSQTDPVTLNFDGTGEEAGASRTSATALAQPATRLQTFSSTSAASPLIVQPLNSPINLPTFPPQAPPSAGTSGGSILPSPSFTGVFSNPPAAETDSTGAARLPGRSAGAPADPLDQVFAELGAGLSADGWTYGLAFV